MPQLRADQVWISSIPTGLNVYFAEDTTTYKKEEEGWAKLYDIKSNKYYLMEKKYLKGKTPVLINNISEGNYLIGIEPIDFIIIKKSNDPYAFGSDISWHNFDPTLTPVALVTPIPLQEPPSLVESYQKGKFKGGAIVYSFPKSDSAGSSVIILTSTDSTITDVKTTALYPNGNNYSFDDAKLKNNLMDYGFFVGDFETQIPDILNLLHRGGKVIAGDNNTWFVVELVGPNKWSIVMKIKVVN
ncbi:MAG: hypothetical protein A2V93_01870 [Ignavibacteria bacterium RBG_16_34_14]|nr:MAG: hypothetical protein A2V93_01870 [Ignavibacteria bacterium RBG_16_34_14]